MRLLLHLCLGPDLRSVYTVDTLQTQGNVISRDDAFNDWSYSAIDQPIDLPSDYESTSSQLRKISFLNRP